MSTSVVGRRIALINEPMFYKRIVTLDEGKCDTGTIIHNKKSVAVRKVGGTWRQVPQKG